LSAIHHSPITSFFLAFSNNPNHNITRVSGIDILDPTTNSQWKILNNQLLGTAHADRQTIG